MTYTIVSHETDAVRDAVAADLARRFEARGLTRAPSHHGLQCALNLTDPVHPRPFRRDSRGVFVISVVRVSGQPRDLRSFCYQTLIRSLSNLLVCVVTENGNETAEGSTLYFTTPEAGFYSLPYHPGKVFDRVFPIATAHYATENQLVEDLPLPYWNGSPLVDQLREYARELDRWGVLPTPFPLRDLLPEAEMRHLFRLFGMTGLSYGNLSVRERIPDFSESSFWMTARGVDKSRLGAVGKDVLFVRSFDVPGGTARVSVPPVHTATARVSVDAVEHAMIYERYPIVGAIVHVHAWMDNIVSTRQNYPCGTSELAREVCALLETVPEPGRAVVGLKNHGITVTGSSLEDIFERLRGRLRTEVPMYA